MIDEGSVIPFGKYKGKLTSEVLTSDPGYLVWLRQAKCTDEGVEVAKNAFSPRMHELLNWKIASDSYLKKKFKPFVDVAESAPEAAPSTAAKVEASTKSFSPARAAAAARASLGNKESVTTDEDTMAMKASLKSAVTAYAEWGDF